MNDYYNEDIELSIIGSLVVWTDELKSRINEISPEDFYFSRIKNIFNTIKELNSKNQAINIVVVCSFLGDAEAVTLKNAVSLVYLVTHFDCYLMRLKEMALKRRLKSYINSMLFDGKSVSLTDLEDFIHNEKKNIYINSYTDKAKQAVQDFIDNVGIAQPRIYTGMRRFDKCTGGLRLSSIMMLGAYASAGKTALALNIACKQTEPVIIFSLEMSSKMIMERLVSAKEKINYNLFSNQNFNADQIKQIKDCAMGLKNSNIYIFDDVYDVEGHSAIISKIKPVLVVIDYIQIVQTAHKAENKRAKIDYISSMYKQIAKYNNCVIMILSQISRIERSSPTMASLKESGALEADGDYVAILHRPYITQKDNPDIAPENAYLLLDKNKFGVTGKINLYFNGEFQQFYEREPGGIDSDIPAEWM